MTKAPTPTEKSKKQRDNTKNATKNIYYTTIAESLRTVSWGSDSHPTGVVKPVYWIPTFPLTAKAKKQGRLWQNRLKPHEINLWYAGTGYLRACSSYECFIVRAIWDLHLL